MKILQLVTKRQYRGAEIFAYNLSKDLLKKGHEIIFAGLYAQKDDALELPKAVNVDLSAHKTRFFSLPTAYRLYKLIKKEQPDIIQCNGSDTLKYAVVISFFFSRKIPLTYRNISIISQWFSHPLKKMLYQLLFKRVDFVTSVGRFAMEDFIKTLNFLPEKIEVIHRGIPPKKNDKTQARQDIILQLGLSPEDKIITHIGNFSPEKNHTFLLKVFEKIRIKRTDIKLLLVGKGILFEEIKKQIEQKKLEDTVFLLGFRKDTEKILSASDVFILTSKVEGVPGVILEAAVQEAPSIAIDVGGVSEVIKSGETGILLNDFSSEIFAENIIHLADDNTLRKQLGQNAFQLVSQHFNPDHTVDRFIRLYEKLIYEKN